MKMTKNIMEEKCSLKMEENILKNGRNQYICKRKLRKINQMGESNSSRLGK